MASLKDISNLNGDSLLRALGLERADSTGWVAPAAGALVVGLVVGGVLGLLFAPESGEKLRGTLRRRFDEAKDEFGSSFKDAAQNEEESGDSQSIAPNERSVRY